MKSEIRNVFESVTCSKGLKEKTKSYVFTQMDRRQRHAPIKMKWAVSLFCVLVLSVSGLGGYQMYYTEAATISIDINPSIELEINRWGKVVDQTTYGQESEAILSSVSLKHLEYEDALETLFVSEAMEKYLDSGSVVSITLENRTNDSELMSSLQNCVDRTLKQCHDGVTAEYATVDGHMCQEAHSHGMSVGKYYAIKALMEADPGATVDEFRDKSMTEIKGHMERCGHGTGNKDSSDGADRIQKSGGNQNTDGSGCAQHDRCHGGHHFQK